ncbi:NUMOD4 motif-containing HNH endonuclease [Microbacterium sp. T32]|uniref:NUMOD4 motif-containing HNH endonuclease n=1 Tax=Microbacterium sp. T32 TaxID=1776083 RepID=UPI003FA54B67
MIENWRDLPGLEGYSVSDTGRIRSDARMVDGPRGGTWPVRERILKMRSDAGGYLALTIRGHRVYAHRAVLTAFKGPCPPGQEVLHSDGSTENNSLSNLRWGTHSENTADSVEHGTHRNARKVACARGGHPLSGDNLYVCPRGRRECRACRAESARRSKIQTHEHPTEGESQ